MSFYGPANRFFVEAALDSGLISDSQITACNLEDLAVQSTVWQKTDMLDVHADNSRFKNVAINESAITRSSFMNSQFSDCSFDAVQFSGLTLIKSQWRQNLFNAGQWEHSALLRSCFDRLQFVNSVLSDFEAMYAVIKNSIFLNSTIEITYGSGMNGFSGTKLENTIFYNCRFSGFPLRGAEINNCLFFNCFGETGDMEGTYMINPKVEETRRSLERMDPLQLADALALALTEAKESSAVAGSAKPEFANFAQAILYLKKNYDFNELDAFNTEADLVYISAADRRILLTERNTVQPLTRQIQEPVQPQAEAQAAPKNDNRPDPFENGGRFSHLEF